MNPFKFLKNLDNNEIERNKIISEKIAKQSSKVKNDFSKKYTSGTSATPLRSRPISKKQITEKWKRGQERPGFDSPDECLSSYGSYRPKDYVEFVDFDGVAAVKNDLRIQKFC